MSKIKFARLAVMLGAVSLVLGCAETGTHRVTKWSSRQFSQSKLPKFDVPVVINDRVIAWIDYFQGPGRRHFARYLARSGRYLPLMQDILKKYALPQDLVYIALIESGFSPKAYSRAHASGHWQFIRGTGKRYGLSINSWVDERRHYEKSTIAAAKYLRDLFDQFGDWHLAMAAYNAGEGKIAKAVRINDTRNFWEMIERDRHFLKAETKDYVPKFIAAAIIAKSPERFGFGDVVYEQPLEFETAKVDMQTDLQVIARCAGIPLDVIEELNPDLTIGVTPAGAREYTIHLPKGTSKKFETAYAKIPPAERLMVARHNVRRGETAGRIAHRYGVSVRELLAANDLRSASSVKGGMSLIIPIGGAAKKVVREAVAQETGDYRGRLVKHRVKAGETVGLIAENYNVSKTSIARWNRLKLYRIHAGQTLKIYVKDDDTASVAVGRKPVPAGGKVYTVRRGDSWWRIAQRYGVSINDLKGWNPDHATKDLIAGQRLVVAGRVSSADESVSVADASGFSGVAAVNISTSDKLSPPSTEIMSNPHEPSDLLSMKTSPVKEGKAVSAGSAGKEIAYQIKSGDTLWDIAQKYGVSVKNIQQWNNLGKNSHRRLRPGDMITLKTGE